MHAFGGGYPFSHLAGVNLPMAIIKWLKNEFVDINDLFNCKIKCLWSKRYQYGSN